MYNSAAILRVIVCELSARVMKFASCPFPEMASSFQKWPAIPEMAAIFRNGQAFSEVDSRVARIDRLHNLYGCETFQNLFFFALTTTNNYT